MNNLEFSFGEYEDLAAITSLIETTGWGETKDDIRRVLRNPANKYILLTDAKENVLVACTLTVIYGKLGFIGHVVVHPDFRKMGIGQEIMVEAINYMESKGCKTIKLDAVIQALSLYKRVGFKDEIKSYRYKLDCSSEIKYEYFIKKAREHLSPLSVFEVKEHDLSLILEADREFFGADRRSLLMSLFSEFPSITFISKDDDGLLAGYVFGTYQNGHLKIRAGLADSVETAVTLISRAVTAAKEEGNLVDVSIGIVANSHFGLKAVEKIGFTQIGFSLRMYRGEKTILLNKPELFAIGDPAKG